MLLLLLSQFMHILSQLKRVLSPHNTVFQAFLRRMNKMKIKGCSISFTSEIKETDINIENIKIDKR